MDVESFFSFAGTRRRMYAGPLGPQIDEFISWLQERHYTQHSIRCKIRVISAFSRWLDKRRLGAESADADQVRRFIKHRRRATKGNTGDTSALRQMSEMLLRKKITREHVSPLGERERVEHDFCRHLLEDKGLRPSTPMSYIRHVSRFLKGIFGDGPLRFEELVGADIIAFIRQDTLGRSYSLTQQTLTAISAFLWYLRFRGLITIDLRACVPKAARWSLAKLPTFLTSDQVTHVLGKCERGSGIGRRNYAILLLLARLGLRAGEVAALTLDQFDWPHSLLTLRGKGGRWAQMPIPQDVGEAIVDYLEHGRPASSDRHLFISMCAPWQGFRSAVSISIIASRALSRAQIDHPRAGAHTFRHALASEMLRQGASLREIARLLRHQNPDTTRIYAKVDLKALRKLTMPWSGCSE
jgi:site-specific recombinase XerD